jgi:hypothetical protein
MKSGAQMSRSYTAPIDASIKDSVFGWKYRLPTTNAILQDRPQVVIQSMQSPKLNGFTVIDEGALPTGSFFSRVDSNWAGMFEKLLAKVEIPPANYTPATQSLTDTGNLRYEAEHALCSGINLTILRALMQGIFYNEGMNTLMDDFAGKYRRINDLCNAWAGVRVPPFVNMLIDKFARVCVPYAGGPIYTYLLEHYGLNWGTNSATNWGVAIDLDRGVTSDDVVRILLNDIELSYEELMGQSTDADDKADLRLIQNIYGVLGMPTLVIPDRRVEVDPAWWAEMQFYELFCFLDNKGEGTDTAHYHPLAVDAEAQIHRAHPQGYNWDWRDEIGFLPNAAMYSEIEDTDSNVVYGILRKGVSGYVKPVHRVYTPEDGWFSTTGNLDLTAADSLQDYIWMMPWVTKHIFGAMAISSEDPEEQYFMYGPNVDVEWVQPHDHIGENLNLMLHKKEYGGFDVPLIH